MSFRSIRTGLRALRTRTPVMTLAAAALLLAATTASAQDAAAAGESTVRYNADFGDGRWRQQRRPRQLRRR